MKLILIDYSFGVTLVVSDFVECTWVFVNLGFMITGVL